MTPDATSVLVRPWSPRLHRMRYEPEPGTAEPPAAPAVPRWATTAVPPEAEDHAAVAATVADTLRAALEVLDGRRPHGHLATVFAPRAAAYWRHAADRRGPGRTKLQRVLVCLPRPGVAEVAAVIVDGARPRALPARFERTSRGVWRCTELRLI